MPKLYIICIFLIELIGTIVGILTKESVNIYSTTMIKPFLSPHPIVFPIVWIILYALMGISMARIISSKKSNNRTKCLVINFLQLLCNFAWPFVFFNLQMHLTAFILLLVLATLVYLMIKAYRKIDITASNLQYPYFIWLIFAGYLNISVYLIN